MKKQTILLFLLLLLLQLRSDIDIGKVGSEDNLIFKIRLNISLYNISHCEIDKKRPRVINRSTRSSDKSRGLETRSSNRESIGIKVNLRKITICVSRELSVSLKEVSISLSIVLDFTVRKICRTNLKLESFICNNTSSKIFCLQLFRIFPQPTRLAI